MHSVIYTYLFQQKIMSIYYLYVQFYNYSRLILAMYNAQQCHVRQTILICFDQHDVGGHTGTYNNEMPLQG